MAKLSPDYEVSDHKPVSGETLYRGIVRDEAGNVVARDAFHYLRPDGAINAAKFMIATQP